MSIQNKKLSQLKKALLNCGQEIFTLSKSPHMLSNKPIIKGSVYELRRKCGKSGCKCTKGHLHGRMVVSSSESGRTKLQVIPSGYLVEVKTKVRGYQELRRGRARLGELYTKMLGIMDEIESCRREELPKARGNDQKQVGSRRLEHSSKPEKKVNRSKKS